MESDLQEKSFAKLSAHTDLLLDVIESRHVGEETYPQEYFKNAETRILALGSILNTKDKLSDIEEKIKAILDAASKSSQSDDGAKIRMLQIEYTHLEMTKKRYTEQLDYFEKMYNEALEIENAYKSYNSYKKRGASEQ